MTKLTLTTCLLSFFIIFQITAFGQSKKIIRKALKEKNPKSQIELLSKAIEIDNKNLNAYFHRGLAKADLQDHTGAILDFTKVIFFEPDGDSYYNRANSKFALGDFKGANEDYKQAVKLNFNLTFQSYFNLGLTHYHMGEFYDALSFFSFLTNTIPRHLGANIQMGLTLMELGYKKRALAYFNRSVLIDCNTYTLFHRGIAYYELEKYQKASEDLSVALHLDANNNPAYFYLGISQLYFRRYHEAVSNLKKSLEFNSLDYEALVGLAIAYYHVNNPDMAKVHFDKAKSILSAEGDTSDIKSLFKNSIWSFNKDFILEAYFDKLNTL